MSGAHDIVASTLRDHGARLDPKRVVDTLCVASSKGALTVVHRLLVNGADPTLGDYDGRTPLHLAASEGHGEVARALVRRGASVRARDRWGNTPLDDAVRHGHHGIASLLRVEA